MQNFLLMIPIRYGKNPFKTLSGGLKKSLRTKQMNQQINKIIQGWWPSYVKKNIL